MRRWRRRVAAGLATVVLALASLAADAATITIVNLDGPGEGFNDPTPASPEGGNPGATRGAQRLNLFQAAANVWAAKLNSSQVIKVGANFDPLTPCTAAGGVLGSAGPVSVMKLTSPPAGYPANTWFSIAEAEAIQGANLNGAANEIDAQFNSSVDSGCLGAGTRWWYGTTSASTIPGTINLFPVVLHELGHGLGFISMVCVQAGGCGGGTVQGSLAGGSQDIWNTFLKDGSSGLLWKDMSNAQRASSMINNQHLVWSGSNVTAAIPTFQPGRTGVDPATGMLRMYAPNPVEPGSSVSHFDTSATSPNLLMEPALQDEFNATDMTVPLFQDIGWPMASGAAPNQAPTIAVPVSINATEDTASALTGIVFADADAGAGSETATFSVTAGTLAASSSGGVTVSGSATARALAGTIANLNAFVGGGHLGYTGALNASGVTTLSIQIDDNGNTGSGGAKSASNTTNLAIAAVNDAPTLSAPASIAVNEAAASALTGISFADVDAGSASVTATFAVGSGALSAAAATGVTVGGTTTSRTLAGTIATLDNYLAAGNLKYTSPSGATSVALAVTINDNGNSGSGGAHSATASVTLSVASVNDAPSVSAPASLTVAAPGTTPLGGISVADPDAAGGNVTLTLAASAGALNATPGTGVSLSGAGTAQLTLIGTLANLNAFLAAAHVSFVAAGALPNNAATIALTVNDNGNSGTGGAKTGTGSIALSAPVGGIFASGFE